MRIGICNWAFEGKEEILFFEMRKNYLSYLQIEITDQQLSGNFRQRLVHMIENYQKNDLHVLSISAAFANETGIWEAENSARAFTHIQEMILLASQYHIYEVMIPFFDKNRIKNYKELEKGVEFLKKACQFAHKHQCRISIENDLSAQKNWSLMQEVDEKNLFYLMDIYNIQLNRLELKDYLFAYPIPLSNIIHLKNGNKAAGMGSKQITAVQMKLLKDIPYWNTHTFLLENEYAVFEYLSLEKDILLMKKHLQYE